MSTGIRLVLSRVLGALALLLLVWSCDPVQPVRGIPTPGPSPFPPGAYVVDGTPTWSPAGDSLCLWRVVPSTWGPPGLYLIGAAGGSPRLLTPFQAANIGSAFHLSADGRTLAVPYGSRLLLVDAVSGAFRSPLYTPDGIESVDWLDADRLVVGRPLLAPGEPHDSSGLAIFDLTRGELRAIRTPSDVVFGGEVRCSPDRSWIAFVYAGAIHVVRPDGSDEHTIAAPSSTLRVLVTPQWIDAGSHVLFMEIGSGLPRTQVVGVDGTGRRDWPWWVGRADAVTPDHRRVVVLGQDRVGPDSLALVLYLRDLDDATGATAVQLTSYHPPSEGLAMR